MIESLYREPEVVDEVAEWPALQFTDVYKIYRSVPAGTQNAAVETVALRGLDLSVARGEMVAVIGPSGCGKSTFLHLAAGLDEPSAGDVRAFGRSLSRRNERDLATYRARDVAVIFQSENLWPLLTARENVQTVLRLAGQDDTLEGADEALAAFGLAERRHHRIGALSGGEQQRVAIAAAAARRAPLVLADEPTGELDAANERIVLAALGGLRETFGASVAIVTHSDAVAAYVDRVVQMRDGRALS